MAKNHIRTSVVTGVSKVNEILENVVTSEMIKADSYLNTEHFFLFHKWDIASTTYNTVCFSYVVSLNLASARLGRL